MLPNLQAHLKVAQAHAEPILLKELAKPTKVKIGFKKSTALQKNKKTSHTTDTTKTEKLSNGYCLKRRGHNTDLPKVEVQWLNQNLCLADCGVMQVYFFVVSIPQWV